MSPVASTEPAVESKPAKSSPRNYPGALVVVEGIDGSGKSTQLHLLKRWLKVGGYRTHFTEWNSSLLVATATKRGKKRRLLTPVTFSLIHAADFADRYERIDALLAQAVAGAKAVPRLRKTAFDLSF